MLRLHTSVKSTICSGPTLKIVREQSQRMATDEPAVPVQFTTIDSGVIPTSHEEPPGEPTPFVRRLRESKVKEYDEQDRETLETIV